MRVLRIIKSVDPAGGGPIEGLLQQARCLVIDDVVTEVVSLDDPNEPFVRSFPLPLFALGLKGGRSGLARFNSLRRYGYNASFIPWLRKHIHQYDLVIVEGLWNYSVYGARKALVGTDVPYVVFSHGMMDPWFRVTYPLKNIGKQLSWLFAEGPLLKNAKAVLFTTEEEKILARNSFWPYRAQERVVGYGTQDIVGDAIAQIKAFRAAVPALQDRSYLLYLSRIHPKKGCDLLLDAFAAISAQHPDLDLVVAGPDRADWVPSLKAKAKELGIDKRVHWPGMLQDDIKWGAFRGAEAFVLPSHQENFGVVVAEAMAAAIPVLITDKVNIWREVKSSGGGMVSADTAAGVREILKRFLDMSRTERIAMGQSARQSFLINYEVRHASKKLRQLFNTLCLSAPSS